jgi:hypothetical protein
MFMRISIKKHNQAYLQELALQMGVSDITEVLNYLLLDVKGLGYKFGDKPASTLQPLQAPIGYSFDTSTFEPAFAPLQENQNAIDPTIQRLIDAGLEMEF